MSSNPGINLLNEGITIVGMAWWLYTVWNGYTQRFKINSDLLLKGSKG
jgi:hypothetical protein